MRERFLRYIFFNICLYLLSAASFYGQAHTLYEPAAEREKTTLEFGQVVERQTAAAHFYKINLAAGQFLKIEATQNNCDVVFMLISPDGAQNLFEVRNETKGQGIETGVAAAAVAGEYELQVLSFGKIEPTSNYKLIIAELRAASDSELARTAGIALFNEAFDLGASGATAEKLRLAISKLEQARAKFAAASDANLEALTLNNLATRYSSLGNRRKAAEYFEQALNIFRQINARYDESVQLRNLGATYLLLGDWNQSFDFLWRSLALAVENKDKRSEALALSKLGSLYEAAGDLEKAESYFRQSTATFREFDEPRLEALDTDKLGMIAFARGDYQTALKTFQNALELARQLKTQKLLLKPNEPQQLEALFFAHLGRAHFALGEREKGVEYLTKALEINRAMGDKVSEAATLLHLAEVYSATGDAENALDFYQQSLAINRQIENVKGAAECLLKMARVESQKGLLTEAQAHIEEALSLVEQIRARFKTAELRDLFSSNLQEYYGFYTELLMRRHSREPNRGFDALAFQANERSRARGLLNLLAESRIDIREGVEPQLLEKETETKNLLNSRMETLMQLLSGKSKPKKAENLKREIEKLRLEDEQIQAQIRLQSPRYAALTQPKTLSLSEIQSELLDAKTVLLEYSLGDARSFLWIATEKSLQTVELPAKAEIEKLARLFYDALTARNKRVKFETADEQRARIAQADADLPEYAAALSRTILAPAANYLTDKRIIIVPDGALQYVPFAALKIKIPAKNKGQRTKDKEQFLIETNEIVMQPSASVLAVLQRETKQRQAAPKTLAVLADPVFDSSDERYQTQAKLKNAAKTEIVAFAKEKQTALPNELIRSARDFDLNENFALPRLPFTRREADSIAGFLPPENSKKFVDFAANRRAALNAELSQYRFVHFATHSFVNNLHPELSGIVLSLIDESGKPQDGFLRVGDVFNLNLPAELVVLSGCRTGLGREIKGEGLIGLTRGFMYAGARRVAVSLWDVDDQATMELMTAFYRKMLGKEQLAPAAALRHAQISLLKEPRRRHPYYWAAFILQGDAR